MMEEARRQAPESSEKNSKGCLFWGCLTSIVVLALGLLVAGGITWYVKSKVNDMVESYTADSPKEIQVYEATDEEKKKVQKKAKNLKEAVEEGKAGTFNFTEDEINTLIASTPELKKSVHVNLEDDKLRADVSLPLKKKHLGALVTFIIGEGRYLNSEITFRVDNKGERAQLYAQEITVNGESVPEDIMKELRKQDFFEEIYSNPEFKDLRRKLENVKIKDGKVIIKASSSAANSQEANTGSEETTTPKTEEPAPAQ